MKAGLGVKLSLIIGALIALSLLSVTLMASYFVGEDVRLTAQANNLAMNSRSAAMAEERLSQVKSSVLQLLDVAVSNEGLKGEALENTKAFFFERNSDIASIMVLSRAMNMNSADAIKMINNKFLTVNETDEEVIEEAVASSADAFEAALGGENRAVNASMYFKFPAMVLMFPWQERGREEVCVIVLSTLSLTDALGTKAVNTTFLTNSSGDLLSDNDIEVLVEGKSMKGDPLVQKGLLDAVSLESGVGSRQELFIKESGERFYGAWQKVESADIYVFTAVPLATVTAAVDQTRRNNVYLTGVIMFLSMFFILIYVKKGITQPLGCLTQAANEIQAGNFDTELIGALNTKRKDEIGLLNLSTQHEQKFLNTFARFTNKAVAKSIAQGTLDFTPHLKDLTIFFSDIRGFTAISDGFKDKFGNDSPREIIGFLNDYMARMVNCVTLSGGNIDKFEGDAIMGVWGILRDDNLDFLGDTEVASEHHKHVVEDALNCIRGVLAMRYALMEYNKKAAIYTREHSDGTGSYRPHIKIGCGINSGRATAGIMGSEYKMEYTAIGDAVNFASRTEDSNKMCGTDILITEDTYALLKQDYIRCKENGYKIADEHKEKEIVVEMIPVPFKVKGKGIQHFYGVVNMPQFNIEAFFKRGDENFTLDNDCARALGKGGPKTLEDVRALLGIETPDFCKVNLNKEENKVTVVNETWQGVERRIGDRRQGDRRQGIDRRQGDRRQGNGQQGDRVLADIKLKDGLGGYKRAGDRRAEAIL